MKTTTLCGNPSCGGCPSIEENEGKGVTISDNELKQKIIFTEKEAQKLADYLCKNGYCKDGCFKR